MRKSLAWLSLVAVVTTITGISAAAKASVTQNQNTLSGKIAVVVSAADQSALVKENKQLLITNRALARKIATKLGITSSGAVPTSGTPLEQNQVLILQNQETFAAIATKVGATVPALAAVEATDPAEKNHKLLLQNKSIVGAILKKLGIAPPPAADLKGTFVDKNHTLLIGNGKALGKIAAKLGVN